MGRSLLAEVALTEKEVKRRFLAYLQQRGVVKLTAFCTAVNLPVRPGKKSGRAFNRAHSIDRIVTPLLPSPDCRVEEGKGTSHWEVRYYAKPPKGPTFAPRPQGQMTTCVDPNLRGSWRRGEAQAAEAELRRARQVAHQEEMNRERQEAREWAAAVVPVAPEPEPSPPSPLSQEGEGEPEADEIETITTTETETMARTKEQCIADLDRVLADLPNFEEADLLLGEILRAGKFSSAYFTNNPDQRQRAKDALKAEKARRYREAQAAPQDSEPSPPSAEPPSPPSPLSQEGEGEPEPPLEDLREDYERQIRELREEMERTAAVGLREKLEAQIAALDAELVTVRNEILRLEGEMDRRVSDLAALRRTAELLGV